MNRTDRIEAPLVRRGDRLVATGWDDALRAAALHLNGKRAFVLASPMLSNESLWMLSRIVKRSGGAGGFRVRLGVEAPLAGVPDLARRAERAANVRAAEMFGFAKTNTPLAGMRDGDVLIVADHEVTTADAAALARASAVIVIGTTMPELVPNAIVALPSTNVAEEDGTFTNLRGRVQQYRQARSAPGMARPVWWAAGDVLTFLGERAGYYLASEAFAALAAQQPAFAGMSYDSLGLKGQALAGAAAAGAEGGASR